MIRAVTGAGVYLTIVTYLGLGLGALLRTPPVGVLAGYAIPALVAATILLVRCDG